MTVEAETICRQCARECGSCCRTVPQTAHLCFPLSFAEWCRLSSFEHQAICQDDALSVSSGQGVALEASAQRGTSAVNGAIGSDSSVVQDQHRILLQQGDAICVAEDNCAEFKDSMRKLFYSRRAEVDRLFPSEGRHLRLRTGADGACVFLGEEGCRLPRSVRPWYCLLFPVWVQEDSLTWFQPKACLVAQRATGVAHVMQLVGQSAPEARQLFSCLQQDWGL